MTGGGQVDYYAVLDVPRHASAGDIRRAYRRVARRHHPDINPHPMDRERFVAAAHAYEVLGNPAARARYDEQLSGHAAPARRPGAPRPDPTGPGRFGVLELTISEAVHLARGPLILTDADGTRILIPAGTREGDQLVLRDGEQVIVLRVHIAKKT